MIETAVMPAYKDFMNIIGKLSEWTEQASQFVGPSQPPPNELVQQFNQVFERINQTVAPDKTPNVDLNPTARPINDIFASSDLFTNNNQAKITNLDLNVQNQNIDPRRHDFSNLTLAQETNMDKAFNTIDKVSNKTKVDTDFHANLKDLSDILNKNSMDLTPTDLLQAQRIIGIIKVHAESGRHVSEGVSDTLEQVLEQQG